LLTQVMVSACGNAALFTDITRCMLFRRQS
jgi:hypothetical protein